MLTDVKNCATTVLEQIVQLIPMKGVTAVITIDMTSRSPIYEQLKNGIIKLAALGALKPNEQLPPCVSLLKSLP